MIRHSLTVPGGSAAHFVVVRAAGLRNAKITLLLARIVSHGWDGNLLTKSKLTDKSPSS